MLLTVISAIFLTLFILVTILALGIVENPTIAFFMACAALILGFSIPIIVFGYMICEVIG